MTDHGRYWCFISLLLVIQHGPPTPIWRRWNDSRSESVQAPVASAVFTALLKLDRIYSCRLTRVLTQLRWVLNASNIHGILVIQGIGNLRVWWR